MEATTALKVCKMFERNSNPLSFLNKIPVSKKNVGVVESNVYSTLRSWFLKINPIFV